jgi:hypothetical protein
MRVLWVVGALVVTPFLAGVSQGRSHAAPPGQLNPEGVRVVPRPSDWDGDKKCRYMATPGHDRGHSRDAPGIVKKDKPVNTNKHDEECAPTTPPPPPPPPPPTGIAEIHGTTFLDTDANGVLDFYDPGAGGWSILLTGVVNATAVTDAAGNYAFTALPGGTYTVCEVQQAGFTQTVPAAGGCYTFTIPPAMAVWEVNINFGNSSP